MLQYIIRKSDDYTTFRHSIRHAGVSSRASEINIRAKGLYCSPLMLPPVSHSRYPKGLQGTSGNSTRESD